MTDKLHDIAGSGEAGTVPGTVPGAHPHAVRPRNLSARADERRRVVGNPASARLESGVGNCFPGLEWDVRNLEGRFFPGLLFWVVTEPLAPVPEALPDQAGIRLKYLDYLADPMLPERSAEPWVQALLSTYAGSVGRSLSTGRWYLHWLEQDGHRVSCYDNDGQPYDGELLWRFVRCLAPGPVKIALVRRDVPAPQPVVELSGQRRVYAPGGVVDAAYPPGELTESMCNPWQHDFRDCACYYWASNHPDVVLGGGAVSLPDGAPAGTGESLTWLDWLRRDRGPAGNVAAPASRAAARPAQMDHFEINRRWQDLAFVVGGREIGAVYHPPEQARAEPYASAGEMVAELRGRLAPMEVTLAYQYLYGLFSLKAPEEAPPGRWATMPDDLVTARQFVTLVAVGEMTHLRWVNQLLWELDRAGLYPPGEHYVPVLHTLPLSGPGRTEPGGVAVPSLQPLTPAVLEAYTRIERPGGALDTAYARCVATLEQPGYPRHLFELAVRIDTDGVSHFERFRELHRSFSAYDTRGAAPLPYLRELKPGTEAEAAPALEPLRELLAALAEAYTQEAAGQMAAAQKAIGRSRALMDRFHRAAEALARRGIGVPFFGAAP